jgi:hypothetical protein
MNHYQGVLYPHVFTNFGGTFIPMAAPLAPAIGAAPPAPPPKSTLEIVAYAGAGILATVLVVKYLGKGRRTR